MYFEKALRAGEGWAKSVEAHVDMLANVGEGLTILQRTCIP